MAERIQKPKQTTDRHDDSVAEQSSASEASSKLRAELDDLLDEIDDVLESNAEEFVKSYIQKGGE